MFERQKVRVDHFFQTALDAGKETFMEIVSCFSRVTKLLTKKLDLSEDTVMEKWNEFLVDAKPWIENLDPSLFQNVILGILVIFVPFAVSLLNDARDSKKQKSEFEAAVVHEEVLDTKRVFWRSICGLAIFSFLGAGISIGWKLASIVFMVTMFGVLAKPLFKIFQFSSGDRLEFKINFLKKLNFSKISFFKVRRKSKKNKIDRMWTLLWSTWPGDLKCREEEVTKAFIECMDSSLEIKNYSTATLLAREHIKSIQKMKNTTLVEYVLPKNLEWYENYMKTKQQQMSEKQTERKWGNFLSKLGEKKLVKKCRQFLSELSKGKIVKKCRQFFPELIFRNYNQDYLFWKWEYRCNELLSETIRKMLSDRLGDYSFFNILNAHINKKKEKISYVGKILFVFCKAFFENIGSVEYKHEIWAYNFPEEWKITIKNAGQRAPEKILHNFLVWAQPRIRHGDSTNLDKDLSEVATGLFPNVHGNLFRTFLILLSYKDLGSAIQNNANFHIRTIYSFPADIKSKKEIDKIHLQKIQSHCDEAVNIIFEYFGSYWDPLLYNEQDITENENKEWKEYSNDQKKMIINRVRKIKLQALLNELDSEKINGLCEESERYQVQRKNFIELIKLLIGKIS